jgi:lactate dehydrogenase-like 2-hydroxyacid dehydrogenase
MTYGEPVRTAARRPRSLASSSSPAVPATGITIYGCEPDEVVLFRELAPRFGVMPTITAAAVSEANTELASGNRCISVGHKTHVTDSTLLALGRVGVRYLSTRSIGYDHINVEYAESVGISVGSVAYSPDSVADYTLMLMLMAVRNARSIIRQADTHDRPAAGFRLPDTGLRQSSQDRRRLRSPRRAAAAERHCHAPHTAQGGYVPSPRSSTHRDDEAWRSHGQYRTRFTS